LAGGLSCSKFFSQSRDRIYAPRSYQKGPARDRINKDTNMTLTSKITAFATALALLSPIAASAQQQQPPRPDMGKMAADLGVSEDTLKSCLPRPTEGQRPERPDAAKVASCLKADNHAITTAEVNEVLGKNGPGGKRGS